MILAAASALEANKPQDQLVKTHVYFPFFIENTLKGGGGGGESTQSE